MQKIITGMAAEGMVLAKEVLTADGRVLCGKKTTLDQNIIDRFIRMEISHITVEGHPVQVEGEKNLEEELRDLEQRFSRVTDIPPLMYLKKRIGERLIKSRGL